MASWMIHLRVADTLLEHFENMSANEFIVGSIAPDSGVPNADWSFFTPSRNVSHFIITEGNIKRICAENYASKYFTNAQRKGYSPTQYSFYLGYLTHLLTDIRWKEKIYLPTVEKHAAALSAEGTAFMNKIKKDWYDLDFLYLRNHPDFRAFRIYESCAGFMNTYMDEFSVEAFDARRLHITQFYQESNEHLDREYPYLTQLEAELFVQETAQWIMSELRTYTN